MGADATNDGVRTMPLLKEAERCRLQANAYAGKPEAPFLLRVADAFEQLAAQQGPCALPASRQAGKETPGQR
jgi:hypothetical protein